MLLDTITLAVAWLLIFSWADVNIGTEQQKGSLENVPLMLVGNKCDETESRELTAKEGEEQARRWSSHFMETSAKTNYNVKELFQVSGALLL